MLRSPVPLLGLLLSVSALAGSVGEVSGQTQDGTGWPRGFGDYATALLGGGPSTTEGALTLLLPIGAQGVGLGRAMTATPGSEGVFWNPAGLARLEEGRFSVFRGDHLAGEATAFSLVLTRQPLGTVGISYHLLDLGDSDLRDGEGNVLGTFSFRDHLAVVSFGTQLLPGLDTGVNFKVFREKISCRGQCPDAGVTGTSYAVDAGLQSTPFSTVPLRLGAMIAHLGPDLQLINVEQSDPLPTRLRVGASYEVLWHFMEATGLELWVSGELEDRWRELGSPVWYMGSEFLAGEEDVFFLRVGYGRENAGGTEGAAVGLGIRYDRFDVSIAKSLSGSSLTEGSEPVHVSFGVTF